MSNIIWKLQFRPDQTEFLIAAMTYLIARHENGEKVAVNDYIDRFAHSRSKERAKEILDYLVQLTT